MNFAEFGVSEPLIFAKILKNHTLNGQYYYNNVSNWHGQNNISSWGQLWKIENQIGIALSHDIFWLLPTTSDLVLTREVFFKTFI